MDITLVPTPTGELTVYQVLDDLGHQGRVWREMGDAETNESMIVDLIVAGQFVRPLRVVAFNTAEGWARDVSQEVAARLLDIHAQGRVLGARARGFVERVTGRSVSVVV